VDTKFLVPEPDGFSLCHIAELMQLQAPILTAGLRKVSTMPSCNLNFAAIASYFLL
jgi:hypothetical protein